MPQTVRPLSSALCIEHIRKIMYIIVVYFDICSKPEFGKEKTAVDMEPSLNTLPL